jgi:putative zinc finger/helix-turn-helix YgiT family protein
MTQSKRKGDKPFPRRCPECGKVEVNLAAIAYDAQVNHDGRVYSFRIPQLHVNKCGACGDVLFDNLTDAEISQALREHLHLLSPQEIRQRLHDLGLMQKEFGERIGVAPETISRWLNGSHIQSRAMDNLMRLFFDLDCVRTRLTAFAPAVGESHVANASTELPT